MSTMEPIESPELHPGACMFTKSSTDLVDTKLPIPLERGRAYIAREVCEQLADAVGRPTSQHVAALEERCAIADRTIEDLEEQLANAKELLAEAEGLRIAIAYTLARGVVVDAKTQKIGLRHMPGQKRIDLGRPLFSIVEPSQDPEVELIRTQMDEGIETLRKLGSENPVLDWARQHPDEAARLIAA